MVVDEAREQVAAEVVGDGVDFGEGEVVEEGDEVGGHCLGAVGGCGGGVGGRAVAEEIGGEDAVAGAEVGDLVAPVVRGGGEAVEEEEGWGGGGGGGGENVEVGVGVVGRGGDGEGVAVLGVPDVCHGGWVGGWE